MWRNCIELLTRPLRKARTSVFLAKYTSLASIIIPKSELSFYAEGLALGKYAYDFNAQRMYVFGPLTKNNTSILREFRFRKWGNRLDELQVKLFSFKPDSENNDKRDWLLDFAVRYRSPYT